MNISTLLRSGCSAKVAITRAWTCCAEGNLSASIATSITTMCTCGCTYNRSPSFGIRHLSLWSHQGTLRHISAVPTTSSCISPSPFIVRHMATAAASSPIASAGTAAGGQAQNNSLEPSLDIPPERLAKLADELDATGESEGRAASQQGRRDRRPHRAVRDDGSLGDSASPLSISEGGSGSPDDAEVKAVFDKLVGNLTKSGKKATARRIVMDAMRVMQGHLRKGDLDKIK